MSPTLADGETGTVSNELQPADGASFMQDLLNEDCVLHCYKNEVVRYLWATEIEDKRVYPF